MLNLRYTLGVFFRAVRIFVILLLAVSIYIKRGLLISSFAVLPGYLKEADLSFFIYAFLLYILSVFLFARRWKIVLTSLGYRVRTTPLIPVLFGAIFINNFTPANRMGGEPLRVVWINERFGVRFSHAVISIVYERIIEAIPVAILVSYVLYSHIVIISPLISDINSSVVNVALFILIFVILFIVGYRLINSAIGTIIESLRKYYSDLRGAMVPTFLYSSLVWILDILRLKFVTLALGLHLKLSIVALLSIVYLILGSMPLTLGGIGVVDSGLFSSLAMFNVPPVPALGVVLLERFISYGLSSAIGALCIIYYGGKKIWQDTVLRW